ncbi:hypothetical protein RDWZM_002672 [Blomia tropicalis]|uniref:2-oxoisovalerate dehydrogenase subunit alpha n=1 Tax=Blomia tropicalis TaxID=40697 RepID=A0A9Q0MGS3_BLOTA|nr:hypothetical protein RDWZM_002672 [Blomia tropicalis]
MLLRRAIAHIVATRINGTNVVERISSNVRMFSNVTTSELKNDSNLDKPEFPGSKSQFTTELKFLDPTTYDTIPTFRVLDKSGQHVSESYADQLDLNLALRFYKEMIKLNQMDAILYEAQRQGRISFYMTSYGEEATHFGPAAALKDDDLVFGQYREPGVLMWRGFTIEQFVNQCFGNIFDTGKGRQMPIHYGSRELNYMTIKSTLTSQMLHAVGSAYAFRMKGKDQVTLCYFGDGAASEGDAHAAFNFASVLNCPVIFLCRNNGYAISTPVHEQYQGDGIAARGPALGIPTIRVDGNDVFACYFAVQEARKICMMEGRPVLIEAMTYRIGHHSTSDDSSAYRSVDEIRTYGEKEHPRNRIELLLRRNNMFDEQEHKKYKEDIRKEIINVVFQQEKHNKPAIKELFTDVYDQMSRIQEEQFQELNEHLKTYRKHYPKNFKDF